MVVAKKTITRVEPEYVPLQAVRADLAPSSGFTLVVDGLFKTRFEEEVDAKIAAAELSTKFPKLQIEIFDGTKKSREKYS